MRVFYAGDSTAQTNDIYTYPQTGMGQVLGLYLKPDIKVENFAKNGRSTKSFIDEGRLARIDARIESNDIMLIQFGHNDEKSEDETRYTTPHGTFIENLGTMIDVARSHGAYPVLISPLARRCFDESGVLGPSAHTEYVEGMKEASAKYDVPFIDLTAMSRAKLIEAGPEETTTWYMHLKAGEYESCPEGKIDNTHLKYKGAVIYAGLVARGLRELGGRYADILADKESKENW